MNRRRSKQTPNDTAPEASSSDDESGATPAGKARPSAPFGWSPRDLLVPYILLSVSLQRAHGYLIEEYLKSVGFFTIEMSTLYRTLRQLEKDGLLSSEWEPGSTGPARRVYTLTEAGQSWLDSWTSALELYRGMIDQFFNLYPRQQPPRAAQQPNDEEAGRPES